MKKQLTFCLALLTVLCTSAHAQLPSYLPADGLVAWYPFNGNANDESGNENDGIMVGGISNANDRFGNSGSAFLFDGSSGYIDVPSLNNLPYTPITYSAWVVVNSYFPSSFGHKFKSIIGRNTAFVLNNGVIGFFAANNIDNGTHDNNFLMWRGGGTSSVPASGVIPPLNTWVHIVYTQDEQGDWKWYQDGALTNSGNFTDIQDDFNFFQIGSCNNGTVGGGVYWNDKLDDIGLWNRALTPLEIQNLYTATNTGDTVDTGDGAAPLPQGIPYQAAARDGNGQPVVDSPVNVRFSLREGAADGAASYIESHSLTTNSIGLFNTVFGNGTPEQSAFDSINWAATTKFLQVEIDLGNGYVDMGTTQLLSVPYAFRSAQAANIKNAALPVYPDNAAALVGGLVAGEMYRTATGDLKIVY